MKSLKQLFLSLAGVLLPSLLLQAQGVQGFVHRQSDKSGYVWPSDTAVLQKLDRWQDLKFGVLFHWGLYSVPGIVESWSICSEDVDWISRKKPLPYDAYKQWYWSLKDSLNPSHFDPDKWADMMAQAGMKYMLFTTKHHDGFCMFDSRYTDFSIAKGPFANHPYRNVAFHVFDAFRKRDFMTGCYFSKPDWHCPWFWNPGFATPNRHINYKRERHPEWWDNYKRFTQNQLNELMTDYGRMDILWLDGGWVKGDDIGLDDILKDARARYPGLIAVDRSIRGKNENYQTPERGIPPVQLAYPWESCIPLSHDWGWVPNAPYKSSRQVINLLSEITAKGGCLVLGIGPTADGTIEAEVEQRLAQVGRWLAVNGKAIYNTRITPVYNEGDIWFTADKDGYTLYAIYALPEEAAVPTTVQWGGNLPVGKMKLLKGNRTVKYTCRAGRVTVQLSAGMAREPFVLQFRIK